MAEELLHEITLPDGTKRRLGNKIPTKPMAKKFAFYGETPEETLIPRSDWKAMLADLPNDWMNPFLPYVHDQDGVGQCNCDATAALAEFERNQQGLPFIKLSAPDLYARINGGVDEGSLLEDAMAEMLKNGIGSLDDAGGNVVWKRGQKQATAAQRKRFQALELKVCPTFDHYFTAMLKGRGGVVGVMWGDGDQPDENGYLAPHPRGRQGGHAIMGFRPMYNGQDFAVGCRQSWGDNYTPKLNNCFALLESRFAGQVGGWWVLCSMTDEGI